MIHWQRRGGSHAMSIRKAVAIVEKRDTSPLGSARRKKFDDSLALLRALGLSPSTIEHYRRLARTKRRLPQELVCALVENATERDMLLTLIGSGSGPS